MFTEVPQDKIKIKAPRMICDDVICDKIPEPLDKKNFVYLIVGSKGQGKTSLATSILTSRSKPFKAYRGKFDDVIINMPEGSARSIAGDPYKSIPRSNFIANFDEKLLETIYERAEEHSQEGENVLALIDDASAKLKSNKRIIDGLTQLVHRHRHLRLSLLLLVQSLRSAPLGIRTNLDAVFLFRPTNEKSNEVFREEFLGGFSRDEADKFMDFVFRKKGDFLMVKLNVQPFEYYRNFNKINITRK